MRIGKPKSGNGDFVPCPVGAHPAVLVDIVDLGIVESSFKGEKTPRDMLKLVWEAVALAEGGKRYLVSQKYTKSLHEKSNLRKHIKSWRGGKDFSEEELDKGFELETLVHKPCIVCVTQDTGNDGRVWAKVESVLPPGGTLTVPSGNYVRVKDRDGYQPPKAAPTSQPTMQDEPDFIPF
jgi:hypothetical protein